MNVVVTGVAGKLGTVVAQALIERGIDVTGVDQKPAPDLPSPARILDLRQRESGYHALAGADGVIHLANHSHPFGKDAQRMIRDNTAINMNVFQAAAELGIHTVLFASSIQALASDRRVSDGPDSCTHPYLPLDGHSPTKPGNPYALSKVLAERMLQYFSQTHGTQTTAVRFPWLAAPDQVARMQAGDRFDSMRIDDVFAYLLVEDAAQLLCHLVQNPLPGHNLFMAAADDTLSGLPVAELVDRYYRNIELRVPATDLNSLVDSTDLLGRVDWTPTSCR